MSALSQRAIIHREGSQPTHALDEYEDVVLLEDYERLLKAFMSATMADKSKRIEVLVEGIQSALNVLHQTIESDNEIACTDSADVAKARWQEFTSKANTSTLEVKANVHGFNEVKLIDCDGVEFSVQESSLATEQRVWVGVRKPAISIGPPWHPLTLENALIHSRAHLNREQALKLAHVLLAFALTGDLRPDEQAIEEDR